MDITLTWDLFVIVFFATVITYSFIIGKHESVKIVIATYIATLTVQGLGNIIVRLSGETQPLLFSLGVGFDTSSIAIMKLILFIIVLVFLVIQSGLEVDYSKETSTSVNMMITAVFGFATAGLLLSTLLTFLAGKPILDAALADTATVSPLLKQSKLMQLMILNQDLWYSLPAILLVGVGFLSNEPLDE